MTRHEEVNFEAIMLAELVRRGTDDIDLTRSNTMTMKDYNGGSMVKGPG